MVNSYQANLRSTSVAGNAVGVFLYVWDWKHVRDGPTFKGSIVSTGPPIAVLLQHVMEGGTMGPRLVWRCRLAVLCRTRPWRWPSCLVAGGVCGKLPVGRVLCGCDALCFLDLSIASCWLCLPRDFLQEALCCSASSDYFSLGTDSGATRPGLDSDVSPANRSLFLQSTRSP